MLIIYSYMVIIKAYKVKKTFLNKFMEIFWQDWNKFPEIFRGNFTQTKTHNTNNNQ